MTLRRVDPGARPGLLRRGYAAVLLTSPGRWAAINVGPRVDRWLLPRTGGRVGLALMLPSAVLETTGARSGVTRSSPVLYFHDAAGVILVASSYGRERDPAWSHNLRARPDCALGGERFRATAVEDESERTRLWALADRVYPGFADYRRRASATGRTIPIFRLTPPGAGAT